MEVTFTEAETVVRDQNASFLPIDFDTDRTDPVRIKSGCVGIMCIGRILNVLSIHR
jgi:hypothetical protein